MASALDTMKHMNLHHGRGLTGAAVGTVAGFGSSVALGTLYGKYREKWYGQWMAAFFAAGGKLAALAVYLVSKGRWHALPMALNDVGQAGVNALGLHLGVKLGLKLDKKELRVAVRDSALGPNEVRIAGELPAAAPGRSLENISVEDLANLR